MKKRRDLVRAVIGWALALTIVGACTLDPSGKSQCVTDGDCLVGRQCVGGTCATRRSDAGAVEAGPPASLIDCDPATLPCGASPSGKPMTCFQASSLAGEDFCAESCDPSQPPADATDFVCVDSGALLRRCHPSSSADPRADCPPGLNCYRTSVDPFSNAGVCIRMPVCAKDTDCPGTVHSVCVSSLVKRLTSESALLPLDHLNCVQAGCFSLQTSCTPSESCPGTQYSSPADFCVPNCDSMLHCPPNYSCARATAGSGSPDFCVPGAPGARCNANQCIVGSCEDTGAGFSVCTISCSSDADCAWLNSTAAAFSCVAGPTNRHCVSPREFDGANCDTDNQCRADRHEFCAHVDRYGAYASRGECRVHCNPDGTCDPQGGLPHGCLQGGGLEGGCYPGVLGIPCASSSECIAPLSCQNAPVEADGGATSATICTTSCAVDGGSDADGDSRCSSSQILGYCGQGWCRVARGAGQPCSRPSECSSGLCDPTTGTCKPPPASPGGL